MPHVARFNLAPVKSAQLQHPEHVTITAQGAAGDRRFLFLDEEGHRFSGEAKAGMLAISTSYDPASDRLTLGFPDASRVSGTAAAAGRPFVVVLYDHDVTVRVVQGPFAEAVSGHIGRPVRLARLPEGERAGGLPPVSLISLASVADLAARGGATTLDPRRFRMLIELSDCAAYEEDTWAGSRIRIGGAELQVGGPTYRCTLTTLHPDTGERDFPTLDVLASYRRSREGLELGRYAAVLQAGRICVGDEVHVLAGEPTG